MSFGLRLHSASAPRRRRDTARMARRARKAAREAPAFGFDRTSALGIGMLIGLATAFADRALPRRSPAGSRAASPAQVGPRDWKTVLKRTFEEFNEDRIPSVAASSTFFILLALFPALGVFVSLYGLVGDIAGAQRQIAGLQGVLPAGGISVLSEQMTRLAATPHASLGLTFVISLVLSMWSANAGTKGVIAGLNVAYEVREHRGFIRLNLTSLVFTVGAILFAIAGMSAVVAAPQALSGLGLQAPPGADLARWPLLLLVAAGLLSVLYRFAPSRPRARWRWITPGGVVAAVGWMAMSLAFSVYVGHFGHYDRTYGSLGAIVGFMTWIWLSLIVVLFGAELNSEIEDKAKGDKVPEPGRP